jgi:hypothetical protein
LIPLEESMTQHGDRFERAAPIADQNLYPRVEQDGPTAPRIKPRTTSIILPSNAPPVIRVTDNDVSALVDDNAAEMTVDRMLALAQLPQPIVSAVESPPISAALAPLSLESLPVPLMETGSLTAILDYLPAVEAKSISLALVSPSVSRAIMVDCNPMEGPAASSATTERSAATSPPSTRRRVKRRHIQIQACPVETKSMSIQTDPFTCACGRVCSQEA